MALKGYFILVLSFLFFYLYVQFDLLLLFAVVESILSGHFFFFLVHSDLFLSLTSVEYVTNNGITY